MPTFSPSSTSPLCTLTWVLQSSTQQAIPPYVPTCKETVTQGGGFRVQRIYGGPRMIVVVFLTKIVSLHIAEKETYRLRS